MDFIKNIFFLFSFFVLDLIAIEVKSIHEQLSNREYRIEPIPEY